MGLLRDLAWRHEGTQILLGVALLLGCAKTTESSLPGHTFADRLGANLTWQPGDSQPVSRDVTRVEAGQPEKNITPMRLRTEIRNRCGAVATFTIGAKDVILSPESPTTTLEKGEAITTPMAADEWVHVRTTAGWARASGAGGWIVFTGDSTCESVIGIHR